MDRLTLIGLTMTAVPVSMRVHAVMECAIRARRRRHSVRPGYPADRRSW